MLSLVNGREGEPRQKKKSSSIILKMGAASVLIRDYKFTNGSSCRVLSIKILSWFSSIAFLDSHFFPFLKQEISPSSKPSIANERPHDFIETTIVSLLISFHDVRTHSATSLLGTSFITCSSIFRLSICKPFIIQLLYSAFKWLVPYYIQCLDVLSATTGNNITVSVLESFKDFFTSSYESSFVGIPCQKSSTKKKLTQNLIVPALCQELIYPTIY